MRPEQPTAREVIKGRGPKARAARIALREKLREGCPVGEEIDRSLGVKGKIKEDEFTSPEAKSKAKVLQRAMKATKNAPPSVRKGAVRMAGRELNKSASPLTPLVGAASLGLLGGGIGALASKKGQRKKGFLRGAVAGGATGAGLGFAFDKALGNAATNFGKALARTTGEAVALGAKAVLTGR